MRGLPPVTIRTTERRFRSGPNLLSDLKVLAADGPAPKWFSFSTTQDSMGNEWITVIYQRLGGTAYCVRRSKKYFLSGDRKPPEQEYNQRYRTSSRRLRPPPR